MREGARNRFSPARIALLADILVGTVIEPFDVTEPDNQVKTT